MAVVEQAYLAAQASCVLQRSHVGRIDRCFEYAHEIDIPGVLSCYFVAETSMNAAST
jgi:hypothetical protein